MLLVINTYKLFDIYMLVFFAMLVLHWTWTVLEKKLNKFIMFKKKTTDLVIAREDPQRHVYTDC